MLRSRTAVVTQEVAAYCGIALASHFVLRESVSRRRWIGTILVAVGAAIVSTTT